MMRTLFLLLCTVVFCISCDHTSLNSPQSTSEDSYTEITVISKERVKEPDYTDSDGDIVRGSSYYLIYTKDATYKIEDNLLFLQFRSSDIYGMMNIGKSYKVKLFGVRSRLMRWYENIVEVYPLDADEQNAVNNQQSSSLNEEIVAKVTHKENIPEEGYYLVYTTEGTYKIKNNILLGKIDSDEMYGSIEIGKYYKIKSFGIRSGVFSSYKNILEITLVN